MMKQFQSNHAHDGTHLQDSIAHLVSAEVKLCHAILPHLGGKVVS